MNHNLVELLLVDNNLDDAELAIRAKFEGVSNAGFPPKLILPDIQMPKINGIEVLQKVKSDERTKITPVVMLTSSREDPDIRKCYAMGANIYIVKPVNFERFAEAIKNLGFYWLLLNQAL